jgi:hypothetical protein
MDHPIRCSCGALRGTVSHIEAASRCVCYCRSCRAFAHFLQRNDVLDRRGGVEVIQTLPKYIRFTAGVENLVCMQLTDKGLLRWYARCCNTPIGATPEDMKISFVGLIHNCLNDADKSLDSILGPVRAHVNVKHAKDGEIKTSGQLEIILRFIGRVVGARINGSYKKTPFFHAQNGVPVSAPKVLQDRELAQLMEEV